jgi:hypothetical protein
MGHLGSNRHAWPSNRQGTALVSHTILTQGQHFPSNSPTALRVQGRRGIPPRLLTLRTTLPLEFAHGSASPIILVAAVALGCAAMDKQPPGRLSRVSFARWTVVNPWGGSRRPLYLDCGQRAIHLPNAIPDRLIGRLPPTLALRTRMGGARRIPAHALPGRCARSL